MKEEQNINQLPKDWKWLKLGEIVSHLGDGLHGTPVYTEEGDYYFINGNNLSDGKIIIKENTKRVSQDQFKKYKKDLTDNTILVSINGTIGNVAFYKNEKIVLGKSACYFNVKESVDKHYISLLLKGRRFLNYANNSATGSTIKNVSLKAMREFELPVPPKETQRVLVSKIEELFSEIDKGIEELKTAQQQLKVYQQAVLKWAFEGKLTEEWRKSNGSQVRIQSGLQDLTMAAEPETVYENNNELPKGWKRNSILHVASINPKIPDRESLDGDLEIQFLPMKLVEEIINKFHLTETKKFKEAQKGSYTPFINGDIIFAKVTPCMENGKIAVVDNLKNGLGYGSSEFHVLRCSDELLNKYLFYFVVQDRFRNEAQHAMTGAVGLRRVPKQFIENYAVPLPPFVEQQQVVQEIESRLSVCDKIEETITNSLKQAEALRQSILKKAFEGKLIS
jgi:type I restriction enzyme S subunit